MFIAPHNDDETLFGAFTILREQPLVLIVYDSWVQFRRGDPPTAEQRRSESTAAMRILGAGTEFCGLSDETEDPEECAKALRPYVGAQEVWAPAFEHHGNRHHNLIARVADSLFPNSRRYMTYTSAGKSAGLPVPIEAGWTTKKLQALACYESQIELPKARGFFLSDQREYYRDRRSILHRRAAALASRTRSVLAF